MGEARSEFLAALAEKVARVTKDWPAWKHDVLRNSFRHSNTTHRAVYVDAKREQLKERGE